LILLAKAGLVEVAEAAARLAVLCPAFLDAHVSAYGRDYLRPKHRWLVDIGSQLARDRQVIDCFIVERQHLAVKAVAEHVDNLSSYEETVGASLLHTMCRSARDFRVGAALLGQSSTSRELPGVLLARKLQIFGDTFSVGDVVMRAGQAAEVLACAQEVGQLFLVVRPLALVAELSSHSFRASRTDRLVAWSAAESRSVLAWRLEASNIVFVISL
jgi:hypothetical protein